jgi:hypothetical protein
MSKDYVEGEPNAPRSSRSQHSSSCSANARAARGIVMTFVVTHHCLTSGYSMVKFTYT